MYHYHYLQTTNLRYDYGVDPETYHRFILTSPIILSQEINILLLSSIRVLLCIISGISKKDNQQHEQCLTVYTGTVYTADSPQEQCSNVQSVD